VSETTFDSSAQYVVKVAVANVSSNNVVPDDITFNSIKNTRRLLQSSQGRSLTGGLKITYTILVTSSSGASVSLTGTAQQIMNALTAAVKSSAFNTALVAAAVSAGNTQMQLVTSDGTIDVTITSNSKEPDSVSKSKFNPLAIAGILLTGLLFVLALLGLYLYRVKQAKAHQNTEGYQS